MIDYHDLFVNLDKNNCWCCEIPDLHKFIFTAKPKEKFTYFVGRTLQETILSKTLRKLTYMYSVRGLVYLFQPRFELIPQYFEFICVKASEAPCRNMLPWSDQKLMERGKYHGQEARVSESVNGLSSDTGRTELSTGEVERNGVGELGKGGLQDASNNPPTGALTAKETI